MLSSIATRTRIVLLITGCAPRVDLGDTVVKRLFNTVSSNLTVVILYFCNFLLNSACPPSLTHYGQDSLLPFLELAYMSRIFDISMVSVEWVVISVGDVVL
jgi:hypothetical protein